jgi:hypothetical protein
MDQESPKQQDNLDKLEQITGVNHILNLFLVRLNGIKAKFFLIIENKTNLKKLVHKAAKQLKQSLNSLPEERAYIIEKQALEEIDKLEEPFQSIKTFFYNEWNSEDLLNEIENDEKIPSIDKQITMIIKEIRALTEAGKVDEKRIKECRKKLLILNTRKKYQQEINPKPLGRGRPKKLIDQIDDTEDVDDTEDTFNYDNCRWAVSTAFDKTEDFDRPIEFDNE